MNFCCPSYPPLLLLWDNPPVKIDSLWSTLHDKENVIFCVSVKSFSWSAGLSPLYFCSLMACYKTEDHGGRDYMVES